MGRKIIGCLFFLIAACRISPAQEPQSRGWQVIAASAQVSISCNEATGLLSYRFANGTALINTTAYVNDLHSGMTYSGSFAHHTISITPFKDQLGAGRHLLITHSDDRHVFILVQSVKLYQKHSYILVSVSAENKHAGDPPLETRDISPLAILPQFKGSAYVPGTQPRLLDVPFDNDDWVNIVERKWTGKGKPASAGISYEFAAIYDRLAASGLVIGSVKHDFWKTGIAYRAANDRGFLDSLRLFGGAATEDNPSLPPDDGGLDGTHDHLPHGTMTGPILISPEIYLNALPHLRRAFSQYGEVNAAINGKQNWDHPAPVYWNSFGVEGVLGYEGIMMPPAVRRISDFIHSLKNFNAYTRPVLSIDSYDQRIYSTEVLQQLGAYAEKNGQQMGFYFIPFAMWSWKDDIGDRKVPGSRYLLKDVLLQDRNGNPIMYKEGKWGAYAMDPTHPAIREYIIQQLKKAKAINARFIKIDFLTAGALETSRRYDSSIRTGIQAYNYGMKTLRFLVDSIMGKDIFITQAISPMFPSQYADTRFISTDVYSHLRNDAKGFPHYGSTEASLANGSHLGWVQGTLWPFTNLDVTIMKNFQRNPDLNETEIKVRTYALIVMGSIFGDGSDFRNPVAMQRAQQILNNPRIMAYFRRPKAFLPLQSADGDSQDQQLCFFLPGKTYSIALFNFDLSHGFETVYSRMSLELKPHTHYQLKDIMTGGIVGDIKPGDQALKMTCPPGNAILWELIPLNH